MSSSLDKRLRSALDSRRAKSNLRSLNPIPPWVDSEEDGLLESLRQGEGGSVGKISMKEEEKELVDFSSNDYLSLSRSIDLRNELQKRLIQSQDPLLGPSSSRLLDGNTSLHRRLEENLSDFFLGESALLFNSGFDANVGIWSTIPGPKDYIVYDHLIHASVHDGLRLSRTPPDHRRSFRHNSIVDLEAELRQLLSQDSEVRSGDSNVFISVESLYSMDGDLCPLEDMVNLVDKVFEKHGNCHVVVDEAHSTGLYGHCGRGLVCALSLSKKILIRLHTFGKSAACSGAVVLAPPLLREYLINYARPLIFSTTMTRMNVLAIESAISEFKSERRKLAAKSLEELSSYLSHQLSSLLAKHNIRSLEDESPRPRDVILTIPHSSLADPKGGIFSPIVPILSHKPRALARFLYLHGLLLRPIGTPTVPAGRELVRVCLHAHQTNEEIDRLVGLLDRWISYHTGKIQKSHL